ncbi:MAG: hypothetical protein AAFN77_01845 [Planctomycetota bacterium]
MLVQRTLTAFVALALIITASSTTSAQEQTRFVLKLNDDLVNNLRSFGSLTSNVDDQFKQRISMIEIQYDGKTNVPASTSDTSILVESGTANISISDELIADIQRNPVRINVPADKRDFSKISLNYVLPAKPNMPLSTGPILNDSGQPVDMYYIRLSNSETMSGGIDGFDKFAIETRFGNVSMPMDQVAGIKFHVDGKDSAVVVLNNGDTITGVPTIPAISLKTDWGVADIEPKFIDALTTTSNAKFTQTNTDFGLRWELKTGDSFAPGAPGTSFPNR